MKNSVLNIVYTFFEMGGRGSDEKKFIKKI